MLGNRLVLITEILATRFVRTVGNCNFNETEYLMGPREIGSANPRGIMYYIRWWIVRDWFTANGWPYHALPDQRAVSWLSSSIYCTDQPGYRKTSRTTRPNVSSYFQHPSRYVSLLVLFMWEWAMVLYVGGGGGMPHQGWLARIVSRFCN